MTKHCTRKTYMYYKVKQKKLVHVGKSSCWFWSCIQADCLLPTVNQSCFTFQVSFDKLFVNWIRFTSTLDADICNHKRFQNINRRQFRALTMTYWKVRTLRWHFSQSKQFYYSIGYTIGYWNCTWVDFLKFFSKRVNMLHIVTSVIYTLCSF